MAVDEFLKLVHRYSFNYVELRIEKVMQQIRDVAKIRKLMVDLGVECVAMHSLEIGMAIDENIKEIRNIFELCSNLLCEAVVFIPPRIKNIVYLEKNILYTMLTTKLKHLLEVASEYDVKIGLEFIGFRDFIFSSSLKDILTLVEGLKNNLLSLILDVFHIYISSGYEENLQLLDSIPLDKILLVHVSDILPGKAKEIVTDSDRVLPDEGGVVPIKNILKRLVSRGYTGPVCIETFYEEYWKKDAETVVKKAKEAVDKLLREVKQTILSHVIS